MENDGHRSSGPELGVEALARRLGQEVIEKAKEQLGEIACRERQRCEMENKSQITTLKARYGSLLDRRNELKEILRLAPPENAQYLLRRQWSYRALAAVLVIAGIFFAHLTLAPFGLGPEVWLFSIGLGLVAAFWTERTLETINCEAVIRSVCVLALLLSLGGLLVMALLRGDILALYLRSAFSSDTIASAGGAADFYRDAIPKLRLLMGLLAIATELGSGMAIFEARKLDLSGLERAKRARKELQGVEDEMASIIGRVTHLEHAPAMSEAQLHRDFHLGMLECIRTNGLPKLIIGLFFSMSFLPSLRAQTYGTGQDKSGNESVNVVIALDLTQSVSGKGYDGKTDYEKNLDAACLLISQLPPGARFSVLAITDRSFSQPYFLARGEIPRDKGPLQFQDLVAIAKARVASELHKAGLASPHSVPHTDIFGALNLAADIFKQSPQHKILILFSDMRQSTSELDLERVQVISQAQVLATIEKRRLWVRLQGIEVYALGVDGTGKSFAYWQSLRLFWEAYFQKAGANLKAYSALRDSPDWSRGSP